MDRSVQQARDLLGVGADSDPATVAHAYRRLARANHPDVSAEPDAAQRFATIAAAYHLLRDHAALHTSRSLTSNPGLQPPIRVAAPEPLGPSPTELLDRAASRSAPPAFIILSLVDEVPRSATLFGPRSERTQLAPSPIVAGPVVVTPVRSGTGRRGAKGGV